MAKIPWGQNHSWYILCWFISLDVQNINSDNFHIAHQFLFSVRCAFVISLLFLWECIKWHYQCGIELKLQNLYVLAPCRWLNFFFWLNLNIWFQNVSNYCFTWFKFVKLKFCTFESKPEVNVFVSTPVPDFPEGLRSSSVWEGGILLDATTHLAASYLFFPLPLIRSCSLLFAEFSLV